MRQPTTPNPTYKLEYVDLGAKYGRGFVVVRSEDGQKMDWQALWRTTEGLRSVQVVGGRYRLADLQSETFDLKRHVSLIPEPENPKDPDALAVWDAEEKFRAGYIPKEEAKEIANLVKDEQPDVVVIWNSWKGEERTGIRLLLIFPGTKIQWVEETMKKPAMLSRPKEDLVVLGVLLLLAVAIGLLGFIVMWMS